MKFNFNEFFLKKSFIKSFDVIIDGEHHQIELDFYEFNKYLERAYALKELLLTILYLCFFVIGVIIMFFRICLEYQII